MREFLRNTPRWGGLALALCLASTLVSAAAAARDDTQTILNIQQLLENGDRSAALVALHTAQLRFPNDGGLENLAGVLAAQDGDTTQARRWFRLAVQHAPALTGALLNLARLDMSSPDVSSPDVSSLHAAHPASHANPQQPSDAAAEALRCYRSVLRRDPRNPEALYGAATLLLWQHDYAASLANIVRLDPAMQSLPRVQAVHCADAQALGDRALADSLAHAMAASPNLTESDVLLAAPQLRAAHRADLLVLLLSAAAARHPLSPNALHLLALAQEADGQLPAAMNTLDFLYRQQPDAPEVLADMARISLARGDRAAALGYLAHARALAPHTASLAYDYGYVCMQMHLIREAQLAFADAVQLAPDDAGYLFALGAAKSGAEALPYLQQYQKRKPGDAAGALALGIAYFENNNLLQAQPWLEQAARDPQTAEQAHYALGRLQVQQSRYPEAIRQLQAALTLDPNDANAWAQLGEAYFRLRQWKPAEADANHALTLDPENYTAHYVLLRLYNETGDPRRSAEAARFAALRTAGEQQYRDSMRAIESRPLPLASPSH